LKDRKGKYKVEEKNTALKINLSSTSPEQEKGDSLILNYNFASDSLVTLRGVYNADSIQIDLKKLK
jgi:hypothetical protein